MVEVSQQNTSRQDLLAQILGRRQPASSSKTQTQASAYVPKGREVHDTVSLSDGAKLVNLNRGQDLAREIRSDKNAETLQDRIKQGSSDIERIGRLFREVFGSLFKQNKA